jgi:hypothetical protein
MKKIVALFPLVLLFMTAAPVQAFYPSEGSKAERQCDYLRARYPGRADNWPGCQVIDVVTYKSSGSTQASVRDMPTGSVVQSGEFDDNNPTCLWQYPTATVCWGWEDHGEFGTWLIRLGVKAHWNMPGSDFAYGFARYEPTANVSCSLASSWGLSVSITKCGMIAVTETDILFGVEFTSSSPAFGPIPGTQVGWRSFTRCTRAQTDRTHYQTPRCTTPTPRLQV